MGTGTIIALAILLGSVSGASLGADRRHSALRRVLSWTGLLLLGLVFTPLVSIPVAASLEKRRGTPAKSQAKGAAAKVMSPAEKAYLKQKEGTDVLRSKVADLTLRRDTLERQIRASLQYGTEFPGGLDGMRRELSKVRVSLFGASADLEREVTRESSLFDALQRQNFGGYMDRIDRDPGEVSVLVHRDVSGGLVFEIPGTLSVAAREGLVKAIAEAYHVPEQTGPDCAIRITAHDPRDFRRFGLGSEPGSEYYCLSFDRFRKEFRPTGTVTKGYEKEWESVLRDVKEVGEKVAAEGTPGRGLLNVQMVGGDAVALTMDGFALMWAVPGANGTIRFKGSQIDEIADPEVRRVAETLLTQTDGCRRMTEWMERVKDLCLSPKNLSPAPAQQQAPEKSRSKALEAMRRLYDSFMEAQDRNQAEGRKMKY